MTLFLLTRLFSEVCLVNTLARSGYFFNFHIEQVVTITNAQLAEYVTKPCLIRHSQKLSAIVHNAKAWQQLEFKGVDMVTWLWSFSRHSPLSTDVKPATHQAVTNQSNYSQASEQMAHALKQAGFKFVGTTICYAFMQAVGMVNDHEPTCFLATR